MKQGGKRKRIATQTWRVTVSKDLDLEDINGLIGSKAKRRRFDSMECAAQCAMEAWER
jgi:hypothetical protein